MSDLAKCVVSALIGATIMFACFTVVDSGCCCKPVCNCNK